MHKSTPWTLRIVRLLTPKSSHMYLSLVLPSKAVLDHPSVFADICVREIADIEKIKVSFHISFSHPCWIVKRAVSIQITPFYLCHMLKREWMDHALGFIVTNDMKEKVTFFSPIRVWRNCGPKYILLVVYEQIRSNVWFKGRKEYMHARSLYRMQCDSSANQVHSHLGLIFQDKRIFACFLQ